MFRWNSTNLNIYSKYCANFSKTEQNMQSQPEEELLNVVQMFSNLWFDFQNSFFILIFSVCFILYIFIFYSINFSWSCLALNPFLKNYASIFYLLLICYYIPHFVPDQLDSSERTYSSNLPYALISLWNGSSSKNKCLKIAPNTKYVCSKDSHFPIS